MNEATFSPSRSAIEDRGAFQLGDWQVDPETGRLTKDERQASLEPRLMALLLLLASQPGRPISRSVIEAELWPGAIVGEDTVARAVSRLRRALGDSAQAPRYIETLPKRGYRLLEAPEPIREPQQTSGESMQKAARLTAIAFAALAVVWVAWVAFVPRASEPEAAPEDDAIAQRLERADDLYMRFTRADNAAAMGLYEQVLAEDPDSARAHAGLANTLVQRVVRWPRTDDVEGATSLSGALDRGLTQGPEAEAVLERAIVLAEQAVLNAPDDPDALKALAFVVTATGDMNRGERLYREALELDSEYWPALVNLGEIYEMRGDSARAVALFEDAYEAMGRAYEEEPQRVGPWQVGFGVIIGATHEKLGRTAEAETWYRRTLAQAPYEPEATVRLARLLEANGEPAEAAALCRALKERVGTYPGC